MLPFFLINSEEKSEPSAQSLKFLLRGFSNFVDSVKFHLLLSKAAKADLKKVELLRKWVKVKHSKGLGFLLQ